MIVTTLQLCACTLIGAFTLIALTTFYLALCKLCKEIAKVLWG